MAEQPLVIEVEGLDELQEALKEFVDDWQPIASRALTPGLAVLESAVKKDALSDMGQTRASVGSNIERTVGSQIVGKVGSNRQGAPNILEYGRGPGMPPVAPLEEWAQRHGMPGAGWAIAMAIGARGWVTKAPHTMSKVAKAKAGEVVKKFEEGIVRELRRLKLKD